MAEKSYFFDAVEVQGESGTTYDRIYHANDFASYFASFIGNGVYMGGADDELKVIPSNGMTISVQRGKAMIDGYLYENDSPKHLTLSVNSGSTTSMTVIACTLNKSTRKITVEKRENVIAVVPTITSSIHELILGVITIEPGQSTITAEHIRDTRALDEYCGYVKGVVQQIQTETLYTQFTAQFNKWFNEMKNQLSTDAAGNLQLQVDNVNDTIGNIGDIQVPNSNNVVEAINNSRTELKQDIANSKKKDVYDSTSGFPSKGYTDLTRSSNQLSQPKLLTFGNTEVNSDIWTLADDEKSIISKVLEEDKIFIFMITINMANDYYSGDYIYGNVLIQDENSKAIRSNVDYGFNIGGTANQKLSNDNFNVAPFAVKAKKGNRVKISSFINSLTSANTGRGKAYGRILIMEI